MGNDWWLSGFGARAESCILFLNWCNGVLPIVQCCLGSRNFPQLYLFGRSINKFNWPLDPTNIKSVSLPIVNSSSRRWLLTVDCWRREQSTVNRQHHSGVTGNDIIYQTIRRVSPPYLPNSWGRTEYLTQLITAALRNSFQQLELFRPVSSWEPA